MMIWAGGVPSQSRTTITSSNGVSTGVVAKYDNSAHRGRPPLDQLVSA